MRRVQPHGGDPRDQLCPLGVLPDGAQHPRMPAQPHQCGGNVHRHPARHAVNPPRHIVPLGHGHGAAGDDVPQNRADAEDIGCHAAFHRLDWTGAQGGAEEPPAGIF